MGTSNGVMTKELWKMWWDITTTLDDLGEIVNIKNVYPTIMIDVKDDDEVFVESEISNG